MYDKGFSIIEALVSLIVVTTILVTTFSFDAYARQVIARKITIDPILEPIFSDRYKGYDICFINSAYATTSQETIPIPFVTSAIGRNGYIYVTADSNVSSDPDLYILKNGAVEGALTTGPGLRDIAVTKDFAYVANTSTLSQVQKINIQDGAHPYVVSSYAFASTGNAIRFDQDKIYVGAEKAFGPELVILDLNLSLLKKYEINSQVNDVYITNKVYVAASDINQLHILNESVFSPSGWETQQGKTLTASGSDIYFGRTVGGFNNKNNHELFLLGSTSADLGVGVYGLVSSGDLLFVAAKGVQVWKKPFTYVYTITLSSDPVSISCDKDALIVGTKTGVEIIKFTYAN